MLPSFASSPIIGQLTTVDSPLRQWQQTGTRDADILSRTLSQAIDGLEFSPEQAENLQAVRAQFAVNIEVVSALVGQNERVSKATISFQAIYEFMVSPDKGAAAGETTGSDDALAAWLDYFLPEKTAERILDFALSYFPNSKWLAESGDTPEARQGFADYIGSAIQKGFDEAERILGVLPKTIQERVAKTHELVFKGLDNFVQNGLDPEKNKEGGVYSQIEKYRAQLLAASSANANAVLALYNARGSVTTANAPAVEAMA